MFKNLLTTLFALTLTATTHAATYYIDYDGGSDSANGLSPATAFKHCPGDPAATGTAASTVIDNGDTAIFKGGVHYRGWIDISESGTQSLPITYDGNTAGTFGQGRAIIDGAEPVTNWTKCQSQADCGGNPNWSNIYYADVSQIGDMLFTTNLCEGDRYMAIAQDPNPADQFYQDRTDNYLPIVNPVPYPAGSNYEYVDANYFTMSDPDYFGDHAYFSLYARTSRIYRYAVRDYIPAENKIVIAPVTAEQYSAGTGKYSIMNALMILDEPGEYYVNLTRGTNNMYRIYAWPFANVNDLTLSTRQYGFRLSGIRYVNIQGFIIQKQSGDVYSSAITDNGITSYVNITDNIIRLVRTNRTGSAISFDDTTMTNVIGNQIINNPYSYAVRVSGFNGSKLNDNYISKAGASAVVFYRSHFSEIVGNTLYDNRAIHGNSLTLYTGCGDILVEANHVSYGNALIAAQDGANFMIRNNILDGDGQSTCIAFWATYNLSNISIINNTITNASHSASWVGGIYGQDDRGVTGVFTVKNNIIDGLAGTLPGTFSHNVYTYRGNATIGPTDVLETDETKVFVDYANDNFRLKAGSPALDIAEPDTAAEFDIDGVTRPLGPGYDIGAYEATPHNPWILGRYVFYNNSAHDDNNPAANPADDNAIAADKVALLPGQTSTNDNYTSYDKGINGIMIDIGQLPAAVNVNDFQFNMGNNSLINSWPSAPTPTQITTRFGQGVNGTDRITIIFPDYTLTKKWLRVTVKSTANTGLLTDDVFYFGNAVGDTCDQTDNAEVNASDEINSRNNPKNFLRPAGTDDPYDHNRDGKVDATDQVICRNNTTTYLNALRMITAE